VRRVLVAAAVLAVGFAIARAPLIRPSLGGALLANAHEVAVYRLGSGPVRFPLSAGQRVLRLLVNFDLGPSAPPDGVPYAARVEIPEEGLAATFPLTGIPAQDRLGAPVAFYLGEAVSPARTREIAVERAHSGAASALVSLSSPPGATASVRLLTSEARPPLARDLLVRRLGPAGLARLASSLGLLDWDQLGAAVREDLLARRWVRAAAVPGTASRRLYLLGSPAPSGSEPRQRGEEVGEGRVAAFTVRGPGTLHLVAAESTLEGEALALAADGTSLTLPLHLAAAERASIPIGAGLATVRVSAASASVVQAVADPRMVLDPSRRRALPGGEAEIEPVWSVETALLALPEPAPPLVYEVGGRGGAELRLSARAIVEPSRGETAFRLRWRMLDGRGIAVASGEIPGASIAAPEDRIDSEPLSVPGQPFYSYLWPPQSAERLEISTDRPVALGVSSPGFAPDPFVGPRPGLDDTLVQRFQREERPAWFRVRPLGEPALWSTRRVLKVRSAVRIEKAPEPPPPPPEAESFAPEGGPPRLLLVAPAAEDADAHDRGSWWPIRAGVETAVVLEPPAGSAADARVQPSLLWAGDAALAGREALVTVDGRPAARLAIFSPRGQVALPFLPPGSHRVKVDAGAPARLFLDRPVPGTRLHRAYGVYEIEHGAPLRVRLAKGPGPRSLGVTIYFDGPPSPQARVAARIDGGRRSARPGSASLGWTRLERVAPLRADPSEGAFYLNRTSGPVWASQPVFVPLHDDLAPGVHEVALSVENARTRAFARFFGYGAAGPAERVRRTSEIHTEAPP
jgi:hypothetical protein